MTFDEIIQKAISNNYRVEISYKSYNQENSQRQLSNIEYSDEYQKHHSNHYEYISAFCHLRNDKRTFKLNRIKKIRLIANTYDSSWVANPSYVSSKGCYIATMAYGDFEHPQVIVLRRYRDDILLNSVIGRVLVKLYYLISPKIVLVIKNHSTTNSFIRKTLDKLIKNIIKRRLTLYERNK